jgi:hypothetical protein
MNNFYTTTDVTVEWTVTPVWPPSHDWVEMW